MKMDVSKFKKVHSDDKKTILKHPRGHEIVIDHRALSPGMKKQVKELPNYDEGGDVSDDRAKSAHKLFGKNAERTMSSIDQFPIPPDQQDVAPAQDQSFLERAGGAVGDLEKYGMGVAKQAIVDPYVNMFHGVQDFAHGFMNSVSPPEAARAPAQNAAPQAAAPMASLAPPEAAPQSPADTDPYGMGAYQNAMVQGLGEQKQGIQQEAAAQGALGKQQADAEREQQQFMQQAQADYQKHYSDLQNEYQGVIKDVQNQHINPNHYMESMSSGKRVATAIGLMLGGLGSAFTGQESIAEKFLHQQIANDIEAQKANLGKSETLLSANLRQFGNLHDATQMTYAMQNGIYAAKLRQAAALTMDPMARARALQQAGQLDMQAAPILQSIAMKKTAYSAMNGAGDPAQKIRVGAMVGIIPKEETEHLYKELGEAQTMVKARDNILSAFDQISKLNTVGNRVSSPVQTASQIAAIKDPLVAALSKETAGRFTEQDAKFLDNLFPKATDNANTIARKKMQIDRLVSEKMQFPRLSAYGISPLGAQRYGAGGTKTIQLGAPVKQ